MAMVMVRRKKQTWCCERPRYFPLLRSRWTFPSSHMADTHSLHPEKEFLEGNDWWWWWSSHNHMVEKLPRWNSFIESKEILKKLKIFCQKPDQSIAGTESGFCPEHQEPPPQGSAPGGSLATWDTLTSLTSPTAIVRDFSWIVSISSLLETYAFMFSRTSTESGYLVQEVQVGQIPWLGFLGFTSWRDRWHFRCNERFSRPRWGSQRSPHRSRGWRTWDPQGPPGWKFDHKRWLSSQLFSPTFFPSLNLTHCAMTRTFRPALTRTTLLLRIVIMTMMLLILVMLMGTLVMIMIIMLMVMPDDDDDPTC